MKLYSNYHYTNCCIIVYALQSESICVAIGSICVSGLKDPSLWALVSFISEEGYLDYETLKRKSSI